VAGNGSASVAWSAPEPGITSYTVTSSPGGKVATVTGSPAATNAVVTGLTNGTSYVFTVAATNTSGTGPSSGASNAVTPKYATTLTNNASPTVIRFGQSLSVSGVLATVANANEAAKPLASAPIKLTVTYDNRTFSVVSLTTNAAGQWKWGYRPSKNATYTARYVGSSSAQPVTSVFRRVLVGPAISITSPVNNSTTFAGSPLVIRGGVSPNKAGHVVTLYRVNANGSRTMLKQVRLSRSSTYALTLPSTPRGTFRFQVGILATLNNAAGYSGVLTAKRV